MKRFGFIKVATAIPSVKIADCEYNIDRIEKLIGQATDRDVEIIVFPELSVTGYTCGDLFGQSLLLEKAEYYLTRLIRTTATYPIVSIVGIPILVGNRLYNSAVVFSKGKLLGVVPKNFIPNYKEFYELRWFSEGRKCKEDRITFCGQETPFGCDLLFENDNVRFGIEICEDLWVPIPPSSKQALRGADLLINLSASDETVGKHDYLRSLIAQQSGRTISAYLYASAGFGESTTDLVFAGNGIIAENGTILKEGKRFSFEEQLIVSDIDIEKLRNLRLQMNTFAEYPDSDDVRIVRFESFDLNESPTFDRPIDPYPFIPSQEQMDNRCEEIFNIQVNGLAQRILHTRAQTAVIGISGGLDSTLALLVCIKTFDKLQLDRKRITGITMPGFGTTDRTYHNALHMMEVLGITIREISIKKACLLHFNDIGSDPEKHDTTYENAQARERTQILMDVANQTGGIVIGTGDLSELALGWATYNGDHMSMYGVNSSIPKTLVKYLVQWISSCSGFEPARKYLLDIIDTPISPELLPAQPDGQIAQKTEDLIGPYELHDFYLYYFVRFGFRPAKIYFMALQAFNGIHDRETIKKWLHTFLKRFFMQQFKRSVLPDGPKVGTVTLSPRGDWRMPSDATVTMWLKEIEKLT